MTQTIPTLTFSNGVKIPQLGLGVFQVKNEGDIETSIKAALNDGYRHIDTAMIYRNEQWVGKAIRESGIPRDELFITTKLWNADHGYEETKKAFQDSLNRLGLDYIDLYLIHWPSPNYIQTWKAMEDLYNEGKIKAIGVSNFQIHHLEDLMTHTTIKPMINQIETHPYFQQKELHDYMEKQGILHEAWGPLGQGKGNLFEDPILLELAQKYNKSVPQVILRWHIQRGVVTIPKSIHPNRIKQNRELFDFELTEADMTKIAGIDKNQRGGADPDDEDFLKRSLDF